MNYGWRFVTLYRRQESRPSPRKKEVFKPRQLKMQVIFRFSCSWKQPTLLQSHSLTLLHWVGCVSTYPSKGNLSSHGLHRRMRGREDTTALVNVLFLSAREVTGIKHIKNAPKTRNGDPVLLLLLLSHISRVRLCATPQTAAHQAPFQYYSLLFYSHVL